MSLSDVSYRPKLLQGAAALLVLVVLALLPDYIGLYQTQLLTYGLIAAIAALGFNILLGYTGLLSFGHSAFFGIGAYAVAFLLRDAGIHSMELYLLIGLPIAAIASACSAMSACAIPGFSLAFSRLRSLRCSTASRSSSSG